jgi:hypothetical protein
MKRMLANSILGLGLLLGSFAMVVPAASALPVSPVTHVVATAKTDVCNGAALAGAKCGTGGTDINKVIGAVIKILSLAVGITAVIMIIIAGLKYVTSGGDAQSVASAKHTIIYAVVGLVIVALAQVLVKFVLSKA